MESWSHTSLIIAPQRARSKDFKSRSRSRSRSPTPYRRRSRSRSPDRRYRSSRRSRSPSYSRSRSRSRHRRRSNSRSRYDDHRRRRSDSPYGRRHEEDEAAVVTDMFIRSVAAEVKGHDAKYEASLKERERNNPKYGFLTNKHVGAIYAGACISYLMYLSNSASKTRILSWSCRKTRCRPSIRRRGKLVFRKKS